MKQTKWTPPFVLFLLSVGLALAMLSSLAWAEDGVPTVNDLRRSSTAQVYGLGILDGVESSYGFMLFRGGLDKKLARQIAEDACPKDAEYSDILRVAIEAGFGDAPARIILPAIALDVCYTRSEGLES